MEKKMGSFMAALRKANGLTQQQVADKLNVSNKTVSKWECGEGYPEITMLPAIAEIYSVTVDELLKGERIIRTQTHEIKTDTKSEKQAIYLFNASANKFSSMSVIAVILCSVALLIFSFFYSSTIGIILPVLLVGASVIIEAVAFINYRYVLEQSDISVEKAVLLQSKRKVRNYITAVFALSFVSLLTIVLSVTGIFYLLSLTVSLFIGLIAGFFLFRFLGKRLSIENNLSPEYLLFKKKAVKTVSVLTALFFALSLIVPVVTRYIDDKLIPDKYSFYDCAYEYDSLDEAKASYYKIKNHILYGDKLYVYSWQDGATMDVCEIITETSVKGDNVAIVDTMDQESEFKEFETEQEAKAFLDKYAIRESAYNFIKFSVDNNIRFDDESLTVSGTRRWIIWSNVLDVMPVYILAASGASVIAILTGMFLCIKKTENRTENIIKQNVFCLKPQRLFRG